MIHLRIIRFPFHTERSPAKIQPAIASDSASEFRLQPARNDNPHTVIEAFPSRYFSFQLFLVMMN